MSAGSRRHPDQSAFVKGENDKQTNESGGSRRKQSGEVREKEGAKRKTVLSLSLSLFSSSFSFTRLLNTQSLWTLLSEKSFFLPAFLFQSRSGKGETGEAVQFARVWLCTVCRDCKEDRIRDLVEYAN